MSISNVKSNKQSVPSRGIKTTSSNWMREKADYDCNLWDNPERLWVFQNHIYDLTSYAPNHPGGTHWILETKGQDITEHFITHHLDQAKARSVLSKYYVRSCTHHPQPRFTFKENGLYRQVKKRLLASSSIQNLQDSSNSKRDGLLFLTIWLSVFFLMAYLQSFWLALIGGYLLIPVLGVAHNFVHMKHSYFRYLFLLTGFTHEEWEKMHCLSHHSYANTLLDFQIQAVQPIAYFLEVSPKNNWLSVFLKQVLSILLFPTNILLKLLLIPLFRRQKPEWLYLFPLGQILAIYFLTENWMLSVELFLALHCFGGFVFINLSFTGHRTQANWTAGAPEISDFAEHQIFASTDEQSNFPTGLPSYFFYAGFNLHAIHHLFPTLDNYSLQKANQILQDQAAKKGVNMNISPNIFQAMLSVEKNFIVKSKWKQCEKHDLKKE